MASRQPTNIDELNMLSGTLSTSLGSNPKDLDTNSIDKLAGAIDGMSELFLSNASNNLGFSATTKQATALASLGGSAMESNLAAVNRSDDDEIREVSFMNGNFSCSNTMKKAV